MVETKIFLNTWGAYNNGCIGYGWMSASQAREFIEADEERDGGEWFIADIDNYLDIDFGNLEHANVYNVIDVIETLEDMREWEAREVVAIIEYLGTDDIIEAISRKDEYTLFEDIESYHEHCDELLNFDNVDSVIERYFDFEAYHRDCDFDIFEASNGICILY